MKLQHLTRYLGLAQRWVPAARSGAVVLAYHLIDGGTQAVVDVPLDEFKRQLDWLMAAFDVVRLDDALQPAVGARRRAVITFDDAYRNFLEAAWPELSSRGLPVSLYVPVGFVRGGGAAPLRGAPLPALTLDELRTHAHDGVTIGSHSMSHANLRRLTPEDASTELRESRRVLEDELRVTVDSFCYPQAKLSRAVADLARRYYRTAVSAGGQPYVGGSPLSIPRFPIRRGERDFERMVNASVWLPEMVAHQVRQHRA